MTWWHHLRPHPLLKYVPRHTPEELDELEKRVRATGRVRDPIRLVVSSRTGEREIVDGLGRWEVAKRADIEPEFEDLGAAEEVDVAAVILDYGTRRYVSGAQKVQMYLDLHERSEQWQRDRGQTQARANAARSEKAKAQGRTEDGHFGAKPAGAVSVETRPGRRERDRIAAATGTSAATVSRVLASRRGAVKQTPSWKRLHDLLNTATKSLRAASALAAQLNASEMAQEIDKVSDQAHLVSAKLEVEPAGERTVEPPPDEGPCHR
jgi:hypothetical protein